MSEIDYSTGALMESINNKVDLDGIQTITGQKTFEKETVFKFTEGEGNGQARFISMDDKYGLIVRADDTGNFYFLPTNENDANGTWSDLRPFQINLADGNVYVTTPDTSSNGKNIATTKWVKDILKTSGSGFVTYSKAGNGYIRFSNGIQICWGTASTGSAATFAKAFSTVYAATLSMVVDDNGGYVAYIGKITTTQITPRRYNNNSGTSCRYIAIGIS